MKYNNYIIAEICIKEYQINKSIRIINSFEESKRENKKNICEDEYKNEKEIKEKCEIKINKKIIPFSYFYQFNQKGDYTIQYFFKNNLKNINYMFSGCDSLINIDLSNYSTQNVIDISYMFAGCKSLKNINLNNINTQNISNMSYMFYECNSLKKIELSHFNTHNVINMNGMFSKCKSLKI